MDPSFARIFCLAVILAGVAARLLVYWRQRSHDHEAIQREAIRQGVRERAIRRDWFWFSRGPFALEWHHPSRCRFFRVECRDENGQPRRAAVVIGPRHEAILSRASSNLWTIDDTQTLTWRWADEAAPRRGRGRRGRPGRS